MTELEYLHHERNQRAERYRLVWEYIIGLMETGGKLGPDKAAQLLMTIEYSAIDLITTGRYE